jgi:transcriptional regulator with XRE-family HTH domain
MTNARFEAMIRRQTEHLARQLGGEIAQQREDAGLSRRALAAAAGIHHSLLDRVEDGHVRPSNETYLRLAAALGADFRAHLYPNTGPAIRDRFQAPILDGLLGMLAHRWQPFPEAAVRRPARGWVDLALHDPTAELLVATEIESLLRRLEQLVRWSRAKADSLPSWDGWPRLPGPPEISQLLVIRRTRANVEVVRAANRQMRATWPAHPSDALSSLTGSEGWPGPAMLWVGCERGEVRFLDHRI